MFVEVALVAGIADRMPQLLDGEQPVSTRQDRRRRHLLLDI